MKAPGDITNVTTLQKNQQVYIAKAQGDWYKIKVGNQSGFVKRDAITLGKSPAKGKMYAYGWFAPVLKSKLSKDSQQNYKILENELGFKDGMTFSIFGGQAIEVVYANSAGDVTMNFYQWENNQLNQSYRIPIVAKELFKLYFGKDADRVFNYFNRNDIPENFTANGKKVKAQFVEVTGSVSLTIYNKK